MTRSRRSRASQQRELVDIEEDTSEVEFVPNNDDDSDEEFTPSRSKKLVRSIRERNKKNTKKRKLSRRSKEPELTPEEYYDHLEANLKENRFFYSLNLDDCDINEICNDWLESYISSPNFALKELVNLILRSCGCLTLVQEHDVSNIENVNETILEVQTIFQKQKIHEFPLLFNGKKYRAFKKNYHAFFKTLILQANERDLLVVDEENEKETENDPEFLETILIWLSSLSTSNLRSLRYSSTIVLLSIETTICEIIVNIMKSYNKNEKNLALEKEKLEKLEQDHELDTDSLLNRRKLDRIKKNIKKIQSNLKIYNSSKVVLQDYLNDIFNTIFVHRFKDTDPKIRVECMNALYLWIDKLPEFFFENSYLRYIGWLLYDSNRMVQIEVLRILAKIYEKNQNLIISGLKQFTEKYKGFIISKYVNTNDFMLKFNYLKLLISINGVGYLEKAEVLKILGSIFRLFQEIQFNNYYITNSSEEKYPRLLQSQNKENFRILNELVRFMHQIQIEQSEEFKTKHQVAIDSEKFKLDIHKVIQFKCLVTFISESKNVATLLDQNGELPSIAKASNDSLNDISKIGILLMKNYKEYYESWKFLLEFITSEHEFSSDELMSELNFSNEDKLCLLNLGFGIFYGISNNEPTYYVTKERDASEIEDIEKIKFELVTKMVSLIDTNKNQVAHYKVIMKYFLDLLSFEDYSSENTESLLQVIKKFFEFFEVATLEETNLLKTNYLTLFESINKSIETSFLKVQLKLLIENFIIGLSLKLSKALESKNPLSISLNLEKLFQVAQVFSIVEFINNTLITQIVELKKNEVNPEIKSKFLLCFASNKIEKIFEFEKYSSTNFKSMLNFSEDSENIDSLSNYLQHIPKILSSFESCVLDISDLNKSSFNDYLCTWNYFISTLIVVKRFLVKYDSNKHLTLSFSDFHKTIKNFEHHVNALTEPDLSEKLLYCYLCLESDFAKSIKADLTREPEEDVDYGFYDDFTEEETQNRLTLDSLEIKFLKFTLSILALHKFDMVADKVVNRVLLNKAKLGSLYGKITSEDALNERGNNNGSDEEDEILDHETGAAELPSTQIIGTATSIEEPVTSQKTGKSKKSRRSTTTTTTTSTAGSDIDEIKYTEELEMKFSQESDVDLIEESDGE